MLLINKNIASVIQVILIVILLEYKIINKYY